MRTNSDKTVTVEAKNFEADTYHIGMRSDLNLIYNMSRLISRLSQIDSPSSKDLVFMSVRIILKTSNELMRHVNSMYEAKQNAQKS